jgi:hypothetical protein
VEYTAPRLSAAVGGKEAKKINIDKKSVVMRSAEFLF